MDGWRVHVLHVWMDGWRVHVLHDIQCNGACVIHKYELGAQVRRVFCLAVQVILVVIVEVALPTSPCWCISSGRTIREPEVVAETTALLKGLREHLVLLDVVVGHRPSCELHCLLEVRLSDLWNQVLLIIHVHGCCSRLLLLLFSLDVSVYALPDGKFASSLTDLSQVSSRESTGHLCQIRKINSVGYRRLAQVGLEDRHP